MTRAIIIDPKCCSLYDFAFDLYQYERTGMTGEGRRPLRGLRAFLDPAFESDHTPVPSVEQTDVAGSAVMGDDQPMEDGQAVSVRAAEGNVAPLVIEEADPSVAIGPLAPLATAEGVRPTTLVLPAPGQRWAYGARQQYVAQRRAERAAEQALTPLQRFEAALAMLPTTGRPAANLDLVEATLAAMAANTVRGLLADMAGFGEACRRSGVSALPAQPISVIQYLKARGAGEGSLAKAKPATLSRTLWAIATFHRLFDLPDPTKDKLVALTLKALRRELGTAQRQARPLRYKGSVSDVFDGDARGMSLKALLDGCPHDEKGMRDRALLSVAYDTGLRASELVAIDIAHIQPASDPDTRLLHIPRHKADQEGEGATAFLSMRSTLALNAWIAVMADLLGVPEITKGPIFRRLFIKRLKAVDPAVSRAAARREAAATQWGLSSLMPEAKAARRTGIDPMTAVSLGGAALQPQAVTQIFKTRVQGAWDAGLLPDLSKDELAQWVKGISAHSTRIGITNDLFAAGEDIAGIMDALRWKSPKMPLSYNRNLAAEHGAAGRLLSKLR